MSDMQPSEPSDAELVAQTLAGNRQAFGSLYDRHARLVRVLLWRLAGERDVPDLTQECFLRAYRQLSTLREHQRFAAWISGIARQVARERWRSRRRDRHEFVGQSAIEAAVNEDQRELDEAEQLAFVRTRLELLDEREQRAIEVFYFLADDPRDAAERLGLSRSGMYALVARAVSRLATLLRGVNVEDESP